VIGFWAAAGMYLAEISHPGYPAERLIACRMHVLSPAGLPAITERPAELFLAEVRRLGRGNGLGCRRPGGDGRLPGRVCRHRWIASIHP
jgi:hypothetical protein